MLGLYALGRVESLDVVGRMVGATHLHTPIANDVALYRQLPPIFAALPVKWSAVPPGRRIQRGAAAPRAVHAGA